MVVQVVERNSTDYAVRALSPRPTRTARTHTDTESRHMHTHDGALKSVRPNSEMSGRNFQSIRGVISSIYGMDMAVRF